MKGLNWQTLSVPLVAGLNQKADARALQPPYMSRAVDVELTDVGGTQTRRPFALHAAGGLTDARKVVANGAELVAFTKDSLYSLDDANNTWVLKATHLAVKVEESPKFVTTDDQRTCDRAELNGVVVYTWEDPNAVAVWVAGVDKSTGAVILAPYRLDDTSQARLVATSTRIMLFYWDESGSADTLECKPLDPADLSTTVAAAATTISNGLTRSYDVTRYIGQDSVVGAAVVSGTLSYIAFTITAGATLVTSTKVRTTTGAIAVSCAPDGTSLQVIRANGTNVQGDRLTLSSLADAATGQAVGTTTTNPASYIAAAHRSTQDGGAYRCYAFWSANGTTAPTAQFELKTNYVDTAGTIGTQSRLMWGLDVASRAVDYDGRVYFWASFYGQTNFSSSSVPLGNGYALQNHWFLFRDDGHLCAKAMAGSSADPETTNWLPGLQLVDGTTGFAVCGTAKRRVPLDADAKAYTDREPRDITFTFDSNEARRCVRLGRTLYVSGGEILQYDGQWLTEVNFHIAPWYAFAVQVVTGSLADGTYAYKPTWRWDNAQGERDRSTSSAIGTITIAGGPAGVEFNNTQGIANLWVGHKFTVAGTASSPRQPAIEVWRTAVNPTIDSDFYLTNDADPGQTTNPQRYLANDNTAQYAPTYQDRLADASLTDNEINPENGALENIAPPAATVIATNDTRLFLGNVAGDPDRIWYSKQRAEGEVAAFNDALVVDVPPQGGKITAIAFLNDTLVVFRERAIYVLSGDGYDNTGGGTNYGPARTVAVDVGAVNQESVALTDAGLLFKSSKGWYLLNKGFQTQYVGGPVTDYDSETVVGCVALTAEHQVRICTSNRILVLNAVPPGPLVGNVVLDIGASQWTEWTVGGATIQSATLWNGTFAYSTSSGLYTQASDYTGTNYGLDVETAWIKLGELQNFGRVRWICVLGEFESAHHLRYRIAYNYDDTYVDDGYWTPSPSVAGSPLQVRIGPQRGQCQAIKIRLTAVSSSDHADPPSGEALKLTGLALELGFRQGLYRRLPAAQKT